MGNVSRFSLHIMEHPSQDLLTILSEPKPNTLEELIEKMNRVRGALGNTALAHAGSFQQVYLHLTESVNEQITNPQGNRSFTHHESLQKTAKIFAQLWFDPLEAQLSGGEPVKAWQPLLQNERAKKVSPGIQFLLGMNAHIIYDLPQALLESNPTEEYYGDFLGVDDLIHETASELSEDLVSIRNPWRRKTVIRHTTAAIKQWRVQAWKDYKILQEYQEMRDETGKAQFIKELERRSVRASNALLLLGDTAIKAVDRIPGLLYFLEKTVDGHKKFSRGHTRLEDKIVSTEL